jgi:hypothetical protein
MSFDADFVFDPFLEEPNKCFSAPLFLPEVLTCEEAPRRSHLRNTLAFLVMQLQANSNSKALGFCIECLGEASKKDSKR